MNGAVLALALLPSIFGPPFEAQSRHGHDATVVSKLSGWRLAERRDRFTGLAACRLSAHDMRYVHGVVTFSFAHRIDTANALFKVDDGPARTVGSVQPEAAGLGAALLSDDTWNPSDGRVLIPTSQLKGAQAVSIRPSAKARTRTFQLNGLEQALETARAQGCSDIV